jgi:hypothetical protein
MKNVVIVTLVAAVVFFADRAVRLQNQRYAMSLGMCQQELVPGSNVRSFDLTCLSARQTRTSWLWHLFYVVSDPAPPVKLWTE